MRDNLDRRHLDVLSKARYYKELKENANRLPYEQRRHCQGIDLRDQLAKRFNMSGRNLDRIVRVLSTPIEVQQAVSANRLTVKEAGQVAGAKVEVQAKIAEEIKAGENPKDVVAQHVPKKVRKQAFNSVAFNTFLCHLENDVPDLETRIDQLRRPREDEVALLRRTCKLVDTYLKQKPVMSEEEHASLLSDRKKEIEEYVAKAS